MIRRLTPDDVAAYRQLRRESVREEPLAFASSMEDEQAQSDAIVHQALSGDETAIFGCFLPELVGVAGLYRESSRKSRHKAQLWRVYVTPSHRGRGIGGELIEAALSFARSLVATAPPGSSAWLPLSARPEG